MKLLMLGDSPFLNTGFGIVNRIATNTLIDEGHDLVVLGGQDIEERAHESVTFVPVDNMTADMLGWSKIPKIFKEYGPFDAVHVVGDMATLTAWLLHEQIHELPIVAYVPIEGAPLNNTWARVVEDTPNLKLITCSKFGVEVLAENLLFSRFAYHGVSEDFKPLSPEVREDWRARANWSDRFVVMNVAQNVGRKQWPRLFEAIKLASKKVPNILLYAHTVPFNNYWLGGHDLIQLASQIGIADRVVFSGKHVGHNASIGLHADGDTQPGLVDLYGMADCFVLPSQVEGFGLPLAEAMACGLPVAGTDYAAGAEIMGDAGIKIPVSDWTWDKSHARYANVNPYDVADAITKFARNDEIRAQYRRKSLARAQTFKWDGYQDVLRELFSGIQREKPRSVQEEVHPEAVYSQL